MKKHIDIPKEEVAAFCRRWQIKELALFGSALRYDFRPNSDVDVLVQFDPEARHTLLDMVHMQEELERIFGREVDLVERAAVEQSRNYIRRRTILQSAQVIHAT
jgi:hypothetical protein